MLPELNEAGSGKMKFENVNVRSPLSHYCPHFNFLSTSSLHNIKFQTFVKIKKLKF